MSEKLVLVVLLVAYASADVSHIVGKTGEANAKILNQELDTGLEGQYRWTYETENGISASEQGAPKIVPGAEDAAEVVQGSAQWTAPDGQVVQLTYTADENGYNAQGSHIPTSPPIPDAIIRSLEYIRANPPKDIN
ncbi:larval cuticle protein LCP-17-like isoform X1 [Maniola jurtina]|uniref:larval cuticle protein LCP-17-like isoform X1 n=1 Tax=Maniola jurtina TaxID=191418 RepID=UPI001E6893F7|nr:larval cuticle protein LCP-17-like isoform X1 [Maniola jurtina]